jgi:cytokinin riboside 5'-monophosphate phosphoribohydrolase
MIKTVCVYASSSDAVADAFKTDAARLGELLAAEDYTVVYGAGNLGLMGEMGESVKAGGGCLVGVIPEKLHQLKLADEEASELVVTPDMRSRKAEMETRADAFIALPGGLGTLEEVLEILVLKQLWYHEKPIIFLNTNGIYDGLFAFIEGLVQSAFVKDTHQNLYHIAETPEDAVAYLASYQPGEKHAKWFK